MKITELRAAFSAWKLGDTNSDAILFALRSPTPITEAGLRELGFARLSMMYWEIGDVNTSERFGAFHVSIGDQPLAVKTMGKLRLLLLAMGDGGWGMGENGFMKRHHIEGAAMLAVAFLVAWVVIASTVFAFRHPWATDTERLIYLPRAMVFGSVDYDEARPRGKE